MFLTPSLDFRSTTTPMWVIFPPGLEDWFSAIGKLRIPGEAPPEPFERPKDIATIQDQQRFVSPKD